MRRRSIDNKLILNFLLLVLTLGLSTVAQAQSQSPNVWLKVNAAGTALEGVDHEFNNTCDPADTANDDITEKGYWCFKKGNNGMDNIHLPPFYPCGEQEGYKWKISQVVAGGEGAKTAPAKPVNPAHWGGLSSGAASDLGAIAQTGEIALTPENGGFSVHFKNENKHEFVIWYRVDAACKKGDETDTDAGTISLDPRGRNGGTN